MKTIKKKAMINRIVKSVICTAAAAGIMVSTFAAATVYAAGAIGDFANMVVLVRFKDDAQGDNGTGFNKPYSSAIVNAPRTYWESLIRKFNGVNDKFGAESCPARRRNVQTCMERFNAAYKQHGLQCGSVVN